MLKKTALQTATLAAVFMLGACSWMQQPAAPVIEGGNTGIPSANTYAAGSDNPYGAAPYTPPAAESVSTPYTPPPAARPAAAPHTAAPSAPYVPSYAPVDINAATHTVVRGDTVYNISKRYHISQDNLRLWNNLSADNTISVGQTLRVKPSGYASASTVAATPAVPVRSEPAYTPPPAAAVPAQPAASAAQSSSSSSSSGGSRSVAGITWQRPTAGSVISAYGANNKGVDIAGTAGQVVVAAADGKVVYAGNGLRGYGNLVIVQHNSTYLTAYGHNQALLVKDGDTVKRGQTIARMGNTDSDRVKLHFEVRKDGKTVNPAGYVPL
ncbi:Murein hydrolase activator NlpD precursor [Kingella potus]|uniref:Murein hydrolase activator NlpD n=1 Tax=Kingella potus TaxID=265175 RepID=A0A377R283_9NEIS|nr:peptidoglycan DD-metalloendopeptidase family protein [Kingella potus]UOP01161.1 peptidoglycan DD-metalloendopeptidase family protein [Kingella potus]STR00868.1 Murein hydrolase activator NlpD precursor [Kingella potus]